MFLRLSQHTHTQKKKSCICQMALQVREVDTLKTKLKQYSLG